MSFPRELFSLLPSREDRALTNRIAAAFTPPGESAEWPPRWWKELRGQTQQPVQVPAQPPTLPAVNAYPSLQAQQRHFAEHNILPSMPRATVPETIRRRVYEGIAPVGYAGHEYEIDQIRSGKPARRIDIPVSTAREDAWRMYMGFPQQEGTFTVSQYRPSRSTNPGAVYFSINPTADDSASAVSTGLFAKATRPGADIGWILGRIQEEAVRERVDPTKRSVRGPMYDEVMGNFRVSLGQDEKGHYIAYYDNWNLEGNPVEGEHGRIGRPFEIYDRIYYDPGTGRVTTPTRSNR